LESGRVVPGTDVALRLALVLGCRIESLFFLNNSPEPLEATMAVPPSALELTGPASL